MKIYSLSTEYSGMLAVKAGAHIAEQWPQLICKYYQNICKKNKQNVHNQKVIKRRNRTNSCANVIHAIRSTNMWAASKNQLRITRTNRKCCFSVTFFQQLLKIKSQKAKKTKSKQTGKQRKFRTTLTIDIVFPIRFRFQMTYTQSLYFATPSLPAANIKHHQETVMEQQIATFFL